MSKFAFNIQMVTVDQLFLEIDPSQLTADLEVSAQLISDFYAFLEVES